MSTEFGRRRRRSQLVEGKKPAKDSFLKTLQVQIAICAIVFLCATLIKIVNGNLYATAKVGAFNTSYRLSNIGDLNNKLDELSSKNKLLSFFFGRPQAEQVFNTTAEETSINENSSSATQTTSNIEPAGVGIGIDDIPVIDAQILPESLEQSDETLPNSSELKIPPIIEEKLTIKEKLVCPVNGRVSSPFGIRNDPFTKKKSFHTGTDIAVVSGTNVKASMAGTVKSVSYSSVGGNYILIEHSNGFVTYYGHLSKVLVKKGAKVKVGAVIAKSGNTGRSTGAHLHFEMRKDGKYINTQQYLNY